MRQVSRHLKFQESKVRVLNPTIPAVNYSLRNALNIFQAPISGSASPDCRCVARCSETLQLYCEMSWAQPFSSVVRTQQRWSRNHGLYAPSAALRRSGRQGKLGSNSSRLDTASLHHVNLETRIQILGLRVYSDAFAGGNTCG